MRLSPPRTLLAGLLLGYGVVSVALLSTVVLSQLSLQELTQASQRLVAEGATMSQLGGRLRDDVTNLERTARQFVVVGDEQLLTLFFQRVSKIDDTLQDMANAGFSEVEAFSLPDMRDRLSRLVEAWNRSRETGEPYNRALQLIDALASDAEKVISAGTVSIRRETAALSAAAERSRQRILVSFIALFPAALLTLLWLLRRTNNALVSLRDAINSLGQGEHGHSITVDGPQELQDLGERLDWLSHRLQELESEKERFLRHVSHELKTPLSSLKEAADLIGDPGIGALNSQQHELRDVLLESSDDLQEQIGHLLAYAAWRREQHAPKTEPFDVSELAQDLEKTFALQLSRKQLELDVEITAQRWVGNRQRLLEAIENLLSNAIKHSPPNSRIEMALGRSGDYATASIRDYGDGVPDDEKDIIFEPFRRGDRTQKLGLPGTGVGLSIVSECALAHRGEVSVEDAHPGSRFVLRWPAVMH